MKDVILPTAEETARRFTPAGWHWKITPEQVEKIKAGDRETVNKVYFDNYDKFERIARGYAYAVRRPDCVQDCIQQVYVDLPYYKYSDIHALYLSLKRSFRYACGLPKNILFQNVVSLDSFISYKDDDERTLADTIPAPENMDEDRQADERHVLEIIAAQTQLNDSGRDCLTAFAFACHVYEGLFKYEYAKAFTP